MPFHMLLNRVSSSGGDIIPIFGRQRSINGLLLFFYRIFLDNSQSPKSY